MSKQVLTYALSYHLTSTTYSVYYKLAGENVVHELQVGAEDFVALTELLKHGSVVYDPNTDSLQAGTV